MKDYIECNCIAFATYRDPLDIVVSLFDVGRRERLKKEKEQRKAFVSIHSTDDAINRIPRIVENSTGWLENTFVEKISYLEICENPNNVINKLVMKLSDFIDINNTDVNSILNYYLQNKTRIGEYNVGGFNRWEGVLSNEEVKILEDKYKDFRSRWIINEC